MQINFTPPPHTHARPQQRLRTPPSIPKAGRHASFRYADATNMNQNHTNKQDLALLVHFIDSTDEETL